MAKKPVQNVSAPGDVGVISGTVEAELPIPARRGVPWTAAEKTRLAEGYGEGQSVSALADVLDRSPFAITKRLEKIGLIDAQAA